MKCPECGSKSVMNVKKFQRPESWKECASCGHKFDLNEAEKKRQKYEQTRKDTLEQAGYEEGSR